jgi:hypothetical protein
MIIILIIQRKVGCWCIYKSAVSHLSQKHTQYTFTNSLYTHTRTLTNYTFTVKLYTCIHKHALIQNKNTHTQEEKWKENKSDTIQEGKNREDHLK